MKKYYQYIIYGFVLTVVFAGFYSCRKSYDPGDWDIILEDTTQTPEEPEAKYITLKVMSYNARLGSSAELVNMISIINEHKPDLLLLRQVDSATTRADKINRPLEVAKGTGMHAYFAKAFDYREGGYGNAVLSRFSLTDSATILLPPDPEKGGEVRSFGLITVKIDEKNQVAFGGTELDSKELSSRVMQLNSVLRETQNMEMPVIFAGNFNDEANSQTFSLIQSQFTFGCNSCANNSPKDNPTAVDDYITFKPEDRITVSSYVVGDKSTSGSLPIIAELKFKLNE